MCFFVKTLTWQDIENIDQCRPRKKDAFWVPYEKIRSTKHGEYVDK